MKKYTSLLTYFLTLTLLTSLLVPFALAAEGTDGEQEAFSLSAEAVILVEADTGEVLYEYNADDRRYPASITKVMTGLLTIEAIDRGELDWDTQVVLSDDIYTGIGRDGSTLDLKAGEILTVEQLLYAVLLPSANEACNALATAVAGSIPAFVEQMNRRAAELGMTSTHYANTHGYHDDDHYTTARDISKLCLVAMAHPDFREIVSSATYTIPPTNLCEKARDLIDTNALISNAKVQGYRYQYATGIKTGYTSKAGYCLASAAEKDNRSLIGILLGGKNWVSKNVEVEDNYFRESRRLLEYGFNSFSLKTVLDQIEPIGTIPVTLCAEQDYVTVQPARTLTATLPNDLDPALFERTVDLPETVEAPIQKGQVLGTIQVSYQGRDFGTVDLVATTTLKQSKLLHTIKQSRSFISQMWVKLILLAAVVILLVLLLRWLLFGSRKSSRAGRSSAGTYRGRKR